MSTEKEGMIEEIFEETGRIDGIAYGLMDLASAFDRVGNIVGVNKRRFDHNCQTTAHDCYPCNNEYLSWNGSCFQRWRMDKYVPDCPDLFRADTHADFGYASVDLVCAYCSGWSLIIA